MIPTSGGLEVLDWLLFAAPLKVFHRNIIKIKWNHHIQNNTLGWQDRLYRGRFGGYILHKVLQKNNNIIMASTADNYDP